MSIVGRVIFSARIHLAFIEIRLFSINMESVNVINKLLQNDLRLRSDAFSQLIFDEQKLRTSLYSVVVF